jgi:hypothetical protein
MADTMGSVRKHAKQMEASHRSALAKAFAGLYRNQGDPDGVHRHEGGGVDNTIFDNMPVNPSYGLQKVKYQIYQFSHWGEVLTDTVDAVKHEWLEASVGSGTPLALKRDVLGGAASFVTAGANGDLYAYESFQKMAQGQQGKDFFFEAMVNITALNDSAFFIGLCETLASGDLLTNRVNCIGFFNFYNGLAIGTEVRVGGVATQASAQTLAFVDGEDIALGFRYYSSSQQVVFFVAHDGNTHRISVDAPAVFMPVSFGVKNASAAARTCVVKSIVLGVEVD